MGIYVYDGSTSFTGTNDDDQFLMQDASVALTITGLDGNDFVRGGQAGDAISGGRDDDTLYGGGGADTVDGGAGNDVLYGGVLNDDGSVSPDASSTPDGGVQSMPDTLYGGDGNDTLYLNDLSGDAGYGGAGDDYYVVTLPNYSQTGFYSGVSTGQRPTFVEYAGEGIDTIWFTGGRVGLFDASQSGSLTLPDNFENLILGEDSLTLGGVGNALDNTIIGNAYANGLSGLGGNDLINGAGGNDAIWGGDGNDVLYGGAGNDTVYGDAGDDVLFGDAGIDTLAGGLGNDLYSVDSSDDVVVEQADAGYDEIYASASYTMSANTETLFLTGSAYAGFGNAADNALIGNEAANVLDGGAGNDFINGGAGDDVLVGGAGFDELWGGAGADAFRLSPGSGSDYIADFTPGQDKLQVASAFGFDAIIDGLHFFKGAEPYAQSTAPAFLYSTTSGYLFFDADGNGDAAPVVVAVLAGAPDLQASDFDLLLPGAADAAEGPGNTMPALPTSGTGANVIVDNGSSSYTGTEGADQFLLQQVWQPVTVNALGGDDFIRSGSASDQIWGGDGADVVYGGSGYDNIDGGAGADVLVGGVLASDGSAISDGNGDTLSGGEGNDVIYADGDTATGGAGDDYYIVRNMPPSFPGASGSYIYEQQGQGTDTELFVGSGSMSFANAAGTNRPTLTLGAEIENLLLAEGTDALDGNGNALANVIVGNSLANALSGLAGDDQIAGGGGDDRILGGAGNDILYGGNGDDVLFGGDGNDTLFGDAGEDVMWGGAGNDLYSVDSAADVVIEDAGQGYDEIYASVSYKMTGATETLFLVGSAQDGTGNEQDNAIIGNAQDNVLDGGAGNDFVSGGAGDDTLVGGEGFDELWGGAGADIFVLAPEGTDFVADFAQGQDQLQLGAQFGLQDLTPGANFFVGAAPEATGVGPALLYSTSSGYLLYDSDGAGAAGPTLVAVLNGVPTLQASDFAF